MDDRLNEAAESLRRSLTAAIVPLQTARVLKKDEFERLHAAARLVTILLKGKDLVSKALLKEFYACIQILRNEAPHFVAEREFLEQFANKLEYCFGLILEDEDHSDRTPGIPRIV